MRCICHNGDRVGNVAADDFNDHKNEADEDDAAQLALCCLRTLQLLKELVILFNMHSVKLANSSEAVLSSHTAFVTHLI